MHCMLNICFDSDNPIGTHNIVYCLPKMSNTISL
jgi:hypothetical protein